MMEPHMIGNYIQFVFMITFNHVGFIIVNTIIQQVSYFCIQQTLLQSLLSKSLVTSQHF
jgi:hypothetical protein